MASLIRCTTPVAGILVVNCAQVVPKSVDFQMPACPTLAVFTQPVAAYRILALVGCCCISQKRPVTFLVKVAPASVETYIPLTPQAITLLLLAGFTIIFLMREASRLVC